MNGALALLTPKSTKSRSDLSCRTRLLFRWKTHKTFKWWTYHSTDPSVERWRNKCAKATLHHSFYGSSQPFMINGWNIHRKRKQNSTANNLHQRAVLYSTGNNVFGRKNIFNQENFWKVWNLTMCDFTANPRNFVSRLQSNYENGDYIRFRCITDPIKCCATKATTKARKLEYWWPKSWKKRQFWGVQGALQSNLWY